MYLCNKVKERDQNKKQDHKALALSPFILDSPFSFKRSWSLKEKKSVTVSLCVCACEGMYSGEKADSEGKEKGEKLESITYHTTSWNVKHSEKKRDKEEKFTERKKARAHDSSL